MLGLWEWLEGGCQVGRVPALWSASGEQRLPVKVLARDPLSPGVGDSTKGGVSCFQPISLENRGS